MAQTNGNTAFQFAQAVIHNTIWHPIVRVNFSPSYTAKSILSYVQDSISSELPEISSEDIFCRRNGRSLAVFIKSRHEHLQEKIEDVLSEKLTNTALCLGKIEYTDVLSQLPKLQH